MTKPFDLDKALAGHTVHFRGTPVDEWHYFASADIIAVSHNKNIFTFRRDGHSPAYCDSLTLGPRIAWAVYNLQTDRLDGCALNASREETLHYCDSTTTPVQVLIEV